MGGELRELREAGVSVLEALSDKNKVINQENLTS